MKRFLLAAAVLLAVSVIGSSTAEARMSGYGRIWAWNHGHVFHHLHLYR
ncbi:MAG: hypothetical protein KDA85_10465 [Planctomycetaceae bacterium]|nr:hypothetical protein [Planctomycetaceae bacterium]